MPWVIFAVLRAFYNYVVPVCMVHAGFASELSLMLAAWGEVINLVTSIQVFYCRYSSMYMRI